MDREWVAAWRIPIMPKMSIRFGLTEWNRCMFPDSLAIQDLSLAFIGLRLKGHTAPNGVWMHAEKISFRPTRDMEFGFERTIVWGGKGHEPVTLHTFLKGFFSLTSPTDGSKDGRDDPGARFGAFELSYRLPFA